MPSSTVINRLINMWQRIKKVVSTIAGFWLERRTLGEQQQNDMLLDFMPAVLEIEQRPPSPIGRLVGWMIITLLAFAVLWATFSHVNVVVTTNGKVVPVGKVKTIQSAEEGNVKAILVTDGQHVNKGDALIQLDETVAEADQTRLEITLAKLQLDIGRYRAELGQESEENSDSANPPISHTQTTNDRLLKANTKAFAEKLKVLQSELSQAEAAKSVAAADESRLKAKYAFFRKLAPKKKKQADMGLIPGEEADDAEFQLNTTTQEYHSAQARLVEATASYQRAKDQLELARTDKDSELLQELVVAENEYATAQQELVKLKQRMTQQMVRAPVSGIVQQLSVTTVGGFISKGQELMVIVPDDSDMQLEVQILDKDIGFVSQDMSADIKVNAYDYTRYGMLTGTLEWVGNDAIIDEHIGPVYPAKITLENVQLPNIVNNRMAKVSPGMGVSVDIQIGKRRLIQYFLSPLLRYKQESLNER